MENLSKVLIRLLLVRFLKGSIGIMQALVVAVGLEIGLAFCFFSFTFVSAYMPTDVTDRWWLGAWNKSYEA